MKKWISLGVLAAGGFASADEVTLSGGAKVIGILRENSADPYRIDMEVGVGIVSFARKDVLSIRKGRTPLHDYQERWEAVKESRRPQDFLDLARFAQDHGLSKFVRGLMEIVLRLEPENEAARKSLGFQKFQGQWMTRDEINLAKGLVRFEGRWVTTAERELVLSERLESRMRAAERKRTQEEIRERRQDSAAGYYYRPSEFWPYYYRGPRRTSISGQGYFDAMPTLDVFNYIKAVGIRK